MNKRQITEITRRDIFDILSLGIIDGESEENDFIVSDFNSNNSIKINYHGRLEETEFLGRLYNLSEMKSYDSRFKNAEQDIWQHRIRNDDWPDNWVFLDDRFGLIDGDDEILLKFLCEIFHPAVREESKPWKKIIEIINTLINQDGYEFYEQKHISGRVVYGWKNSSKVSIEIPSLLETINSKLKIIGEGSYAKVFKYYDEFYKENFVLKRAKSDLDEKELKRFKQEFNIMKKLNSPYIVKVYNYDDNKNEYIMEYMDITLEKYINENNGKLTFNERKNIGYQILRAFKYIHSETFLHRDISHKNILIKKYDDGIFVVKISDFGLVKNPQNNLTSDDTEYKGIFNDPSLKLTGFSTYSLLHEIYAITVTLYFVLTGKTNTEKIKNKELKNFVSKGMDSKIENRYQDIEELYNSFASLKEFT